MRIAFMLGALVLLPLTVSGQMAPPDLSALSGPYLGQTPPDTVPVVFAPGVFQDDVHSAPTFTPDGSEVYWSSGYIPEGRRSRTQYIFTSRIDGGLWTPPQIAPFSGEYHDGGPFITPDGARLFFYSIRPATEGGESSSGTDIWYMERAGSGWGIPERLPLNSDQFEGMQSVAADGTMYFQSNRRGVYGIFDIFVSEPDSLSYSTAANIGAPITSAQIESAPFIAPDESYVIFTYSNRPGYNGLNISFRQADGSWSEPVVMKSLTDAGSDQRFPSLSHDGKYLFFTASQNGKSQVYWVDASIIDRFRPSEEQ
jgi:Tol biopolymer transport system component